MSIQTGTGESIIVDSNDLSITHRGIKIAVKIRDTRSLGGMISIMGVKQNPATGQWLWDVALDDDIFSNDSVTPESVVAKYNSAKEFVRQVILPRLQAWLTKLFPAIPATGTPPAPAPRTALEAILDSIAGIKLTFNADGTVTASIP